MEQLFILLVLAGIVGLCLGPIGFFRAGAARRELRELQRAVAQLRGEVAGMAAALAAAGFRPPAPAPGGSMVAWQEAQEAEAEAAARAAQAMPGGQSGMAPPGGPARAGGEMTAPAPGDAPPGEPGGAAPSPFDQAGAAAPAGSPPAGPGQQAGAPPPPTRSLEEVLTLRWGVWLGAARCCSPPSSCCASQWRKGGSGPRRAACSRP